MVSPLVYVTVSARAGTAPRPNRRAEHVATRTMRPARLQREVIGMLDRPRFGGHGSLCWSDRSGVVITATPDRRAEHDAQELRQIALTMSRR